MEITSLIENISTHENLEAEHGLSLFIKNDDKEYLLDTGASASFYTNSQHLGLNLKSLDGVIISHNHNDHIGGLEYLLSVSDVSKVYIKRAAYNSFFVKEGAFEKNISVGKDFFDTYSDKIIWVDNELQLDNNIYLLSSDNNISDYVCQDIRLHMCDNGKLVKDDFSHELFLVYIYENKLAIISSCSHNGIVNIINSAKRRFPGKVISHIVGGFHMKGSQNMDSLNCSPEYVSKVADQLSQVGSEIFTCHCTGTKAYGLLKEELGDKINYFSTGCFLEI